MSPCVSALFKSNWAAMENSLLLLYLISVVRFTYNAAITLAVNKLVYAYNKYITLTPEHKLSMNSNWILSIEWAILHRTQTKEMQVGIHYHGFLLLHILLGYSVTQSSYSVWEIRGGVPLHFTELHALVACQLFAGQCSLMAVYTIWT